MKSRVAIVIFSVLCWCSIAKAQQEKELFLSMLDDSLEQTEYISAAFKSTRIIDGQSVEMLGSGSLDVRILHRFGLISGGAGQLYGLDQSTVRFGFDYAATNDLLIGVGRSTAKKELDGFIKYRLFQQSRGARTMPVSIVLVTGMTCQTLPWEDETALNYFTSRLGFYHQVLVGSKLASWVSLQLSPTVVHRNLVEHESDPRDIFALGIGGRIKLTNRIALTAEWYHPFNQVASTVTYDPFSLGIDIETGGHVFQIHVTNAVGMNERSFITETSNDWMKGQVQLGFNLSRVFQL